MNAVRIVDVLLEQEDEVEIDLSRFVRGALGFGMILPTRAKHWERAKGCEVYEKDYEWEPGHCALEVEVYHYMKDHGMRPDSAHVSFVFQAAYTQGIYAHADVYSLSAVPGKMALVIDAITDCVQEVDAAVNRWKAQLAPGRVSSATQTMPIVDQIKPIIKMASSKMAGDQRERDSWSGVAPKPSP